MNKASQHLEDNYFDSSSLYVFLYKYKLHLLIVVVLSVVVSGLVSLTIEEKFKSLAVIYPSKTSSLSQALLASYSGGKTDLLEFGGEVKAEQLLEILESEKVRRLIIKRFDLMNHYDILGSGTSTPNDLMKELFEENITFKQNKNMAIEIKVLDHSADTAALIANGVVKVLDEVMVAIRKERADKGLMIVEKLYQDVSKGIEDLEDSLHIIMGKGVLDISAQSEVYGNAYAQAISKGNSAAVKALQKKMDILSEYGGTYMRLQEQLNSERRRFSHLKDRYNEAKIDAETNIQNFFVISEPVVAEKKSYPIRWLIVFVSVVTTLLTALLTIFFYEQNQKIKAQL